MSLHYLFTAAKVLRATQQVAMSVVFFYYLATRLRDREGSRLSRKRQRTLRMLDD